MSKNERNYIHAQLILINVNTWCSVKSKHKTSFLFRFGLAFALVSLLRLGFGLLFLLLWESGGHFMTFIGNICLQKLCRSERGGRARGVFVINLSRNKNMCSGLKNCSALSGWFAWNGSKMTAFVAWQVVSLMKNEQQSQKLSKSSSALYFSQQLVARQVQGCCMSYFAGFMPKLVIHLQQGQFDQIQLLFRKN